MPTPRKGENKADFVARYMAHPESQKSFPDQKQRLAVAYSTYGEAKKMFVAKVNLIGEVEIVK